jgi:exopolysaccharide/PEP-CTERM locus tyrosine autokinase
MSDMRPIPKKGSLLERAQSRFELDIPLLRPTTVGRTADDQRERDVPRNRPVPSSGLITPTQPDDKSRDVSERSTAGLAPTNLTDGGVRVPVARRPMVVGPVQNIERRRLADHGLINPDASVDALGEEFRLIKRQLMRAITPDPRGHRILVTSAQPDEGKTFTALNLALSMAVDQERSVLLIDGDFARGDVARRLGLSSQYGLMDALSDPSIDIAQTIVPTDVGNLAVLPAGAASTRDTELLGSARMLEILNRLQGDAPDRILIFDSTPLLAASSAGVLASLCGQVLVVVRAEVTREAALRDAIGLIGQHNGISLLLNRVRFTPEGRRFGSYYGEGG